MKQALPLSLSHLVVFPLHLSLSHPTPPRLSLEATLLTGDGKTQDSRSRVCARVCVCVCVCVWWVDMSLKTNRKKLECVRERECVCVCVCKCPHAYNLIRFIHNTFP